VTNDEMLELCDRIEAMAYELWDSNRLEYSHYFDLTAEIEHIVNIIKPKKTNGDRLREMNDEELAELLDNSQCAHCAYEEGCDDNAECSRGILEWLRKKVNEDNGTS